MGNNSSKVENNSGPTCIAKWDDKVLAESKDTIENEGVYFPRDSLKKDCFTESKYVSTCPFKGKVKHFHLVIDGQVIQENIAWCYEECKINEIQGRVGFYVNKGVVIQKE